jgi:hypothetical protein
VSEFPAGGLGLSAVAAQKRWVLRPAPIPHSLLTSVTTTAHQTLLEAQDLGADGLVVVVVEPLDDLEGPAALKHVPADNVAPQRAGLVAITSLGQ